MFFTPKQRQLIDLHATSVSVVRAVENSDRRHFMFYMTNGRDRSLLGAWRSVDSWVVGDKRPDFAVAVYVYGWQGLSLTVGGFRDYVEEYAPDTTRPGAFTPGQIEQLKDRAENISVVNDATHPGRLCYAFYIKGAPDESLNGAWITAGHWTEGEKMPSFGDALAGYVWSQFDVIQAAFVMFIEERRRLVRVDDPNKGSVFMTCPGVAKFYGGKFDPHYTEVNSDGVTGTLHELDELSALHGGVDPMPSLMEPRWNRDGTDFTACPEVANFYGGKFDPHYTKVNSDGVTPQRIKVGDVVKVVRVSQYLNDHDNPDQQYLRKHRGVVSVLSPSRAAVIFGDGARTFNIPLEYLKVSN